MANYILSIFGGFLTATFTFYSIKALWGFNLRDIGELFRPSRVQVAPVADFTPDTPRPKSIPDYAELVYAGREPHVSHREVTRRGVYDNDGRPVVQSMYFVVIRENSAIYGHKIYMN